MDPSGKDSTNYSYRLLCPYTTGWSQNQVAAAIINTTINRLKQMLQNHQTIFRWCICIILLSKPSENKIYHKTLITFTNICGLHARSDFSAINFQERGYENHGSWALLMFSLRIISFGFGVGFAACIARLAVLLWKIASGHNKYF